MTQNYFDPYIEWLGIRDPQRPPNHYCLLGITECEDNVRVVTNAADRQMAHVRTFQTGEYSVVSQRLLNELTAARICLLNPQKKAQYDAALRASRAPAPPVAPPTQPAVPVASHAPPPSQQQIHYPQNPPPVTYPEQPATPQFSVGDPSGIRRRQSNPLTMMILTVVLLLLAAGGLGGALIFLAPEEGGWFASNSNTTEPDDNPVEGDPSEIVDPVGSTEMDLEVETLENTRDPFFNPDEILASVAPVNNEPVTTDTPPDPMFVEGHEKEHNYTGLMPWEENARIGNPFTTTGPPSRITSEVNSFLKGARAALAQRDSERASKMYYLASDAAKTPADTQVVKDYQMLHTYWVEFYNAANKAVADLKPGTQLSILSCPAKVVSIGSGSVVLQSGDKRKKYSIVFAEMTPEFAETMALRELDKTLPSTNATVSAFHAVDRAGNRAVANTYCLSAQSAGLSIDGLSRELKTNYTLASSTIPTPSPPPVRPTPPSQVSRGNSWISDTDVDKITTKHAVPEAALLKVAKVRVKDNFAEKLKNATNFGDTRSLTRELYKMALATKTDQPAQYALFLAAQEAALRGSSYDSASVALDSRLARFEEDPYDAHLDLLIQATKMTTGLHSQTILKAYDQHATKAISERKFDKANAFYKYAALATKKFKDRDTAKILGEKRENLVSLIRCYEVAQSAKKTLEGDADNPAANLAYGRYLCLIDQNWTTGLPHLAKGKNNLFDEVVQAELAEVADGLSQAELADAWLALTKKIQLCERGGVHARAVYWYEKAIETLEGLPLAETKKKLAHAKHAMSLMHTPLSVSPKEVDALALVEAKHCSSASTTFKWIRKDSRVGIAETGKEASISVPVYPNGDYTVTIDFQIVAKTDYPHVYVGLPVGTSKVSVFFANAASRANKCGLANVKGISTSARSSTSGVNPTLQTPTVTITGGAMHRITAYVKKVGDEYAIDTNLDGKTRITWQGPASDLSCPHDFVCPLGVGCVSGGIIISKFEVSMVNGTLDPRE